MAASTMALIALVRRVNHGVGVACGALLLLMAGFVLLEILLRQTTGSLGGTDEISGYVMAVVAAWGFSYALVERAHVRIDLLQRRLAPARRALLDLVALVLLAATAATVSLYGWDVLAKTLARGSRANTPLETPLWIPQSIWLAGWIWFAISATLLVFCLLVLMGRRQYGAIEQVAGSADELTSPS